uniref:Fasciclin-2 n=1 Tax=Timema shepardi TaxID=629360 RepID=A0A7R9G4K1_TIMSH|nr:unnamed protein product [Timema shepardi]
MEQSIAIDPLPTRTYCTKDVTCCIVVTPPLLLIVLSLSTEMVLSEVEPRLEILPYQEVLIRPIGKNVLITCHAIVEGKNLITDLHWHDPSGRVINDWYILGRDDNNTLSIGNNSGVCIVTTCSSKTLFRDIINLRTCKGPRNQMHTMVMPGDNTLALIFPSLLESEAGNYTCTANFASSEKLSKTVQIETIIAVTWLDAPEEQYPILNSDYKVRCKVMANPPPNIDWQKNSELITPGGRYVVESDGLLIQKASESDDGVYTCRAIVIETGELAERNIRVEVHTPPTFEDMGSEPVEVIEGEQASVTCKAKGKPQPKFSWIKSLKQENLASADRFAVNELTGVLTITRVAKEDDGEYVCVARNAAGSVERTVRLSVVTKPVVVTYTNISVAMEKDATLQCSASGRPSPFVTFRKLTSPNRYVLGAQPTDDRIDLVNKYDTERQETIGILRIAGVLRSDDGLYECIATNKGGTYFKNGHLTVQFPPSFANTPVKEVWSWNKNPANLTCFAEAIPNASISWKMNSRDLEMSRDQYIQKQGNGPFSSLIVTPVSDQYYAFYQCIATNPLGRSETTIQLRQARAPSEILQAKLEIITATTITFSFVGVKDTGGLPIRAYAVQYKEERVDWDRARNKTWAVDSPYILEGLEPQTRYNFRFAAKNDAGFGPWAAPEHHTMPSRSYPEEPKFLNAAQDGIVHSAYYNHFELQWKIPADNGELIDKYDIKFCPVRRLNDVWTEIPGMSCKTVEQRSHEPTSLLLAGLQPDTHYKIELRAHNNIGYSTPGQIVVKTARDPSSTGIYYGETSSSTSRATNCRYITSLTLASLVFLFFRPCP